MSHRCLMLGFLFAVVLPAAEALPVVTGSTIVHDLTVRIGGERIAATCLMQPGVDPHHYHPVPEDARRLAQARVVVINGLGFEGWFEALASESGFSGQLVVASAGIAPLTMATADDEAHAGHGHEHEHGEAADPHAFNSLHTGVRYCDAIRDGLTAADPEGGAGYRERAALLTRELRQLDAWARTEIARLPMAKRILVTNHNALAYFARDYGFQIRAPNTALHESEPSAQDVAALVAFIRAQGVRAIFLEAGKQASVIEQIAREAGVSLGGELYLDGLGAAGSGIDSYASVFRHNVTTIVSALE